MKLQQEKLLLEGLTRSTDAVAKVRKIIQIYLIKIKCNSSCLHFTVIWSITLRGEKSL